MLQEIGKMVVKNCSRNACDNIMCDTYIYGDIGYVCDTCKQEFKVYLVKNAIGVETEGAILVARLFTEDWVALFSDGENKMGELTATHWMPLPSPPACS